MITTNNRNSLYTVYRVDTENMICKFICHVSAENLVSAYEQVEGENLRVMPSLETVNGIGLAALRVARSAAKRALTRGATTATERTIYNDLTHVVTVLNTYPSAVTATDIQSLVSALNPDSQDFYSVALEGLYNAMVDFDYVDDATSGEDLHDIYTSGYRAISRYLRASRTRGEREVSTEYIAVNGGDLVSITAYTAKLVGNGERYTPDNSGDLTPEQLERLATVIHDGFATLKESHRKTAKMLVKGMSQKAIAEKEGVNRTAIVKRVSLIREHLGEYIRGHEPEFAYMINISTETAKGNKSRKADYMKEYMKAYRAKQDK